LQRRRQALQASAEIDQTRRDRNSCRRLQQTDNLAAKGQLDTCSDTQDRTANPNLDRRVAGTGRLFATLEQSRCVDAGVSNPRPNGNSGRQA
jgi:hypothetical protein